MKKHLIVILCAFCIGYTVNGLIKEFITTANADVAGMGYYDLKYDWDFKHAVESIVEDCSVDGNSISC